MAASYGLKNEKPIAGSPEMGSRALRKKLLVGSSQAARLTPTPFMSGATTSGEQD
jgi:hypothetical protein